LWAREELNSVLFETTRYLSRSGRRKHASFASPVSRLGRVTSAVSQPQRAGGRHCAWWLGVAARRTRLVVDGCTCPLADEEEAMSTAEPLGEDQWPATGVNLETRRRRILATLIALGRPSEVQQFQRRWLPRRERRPKPAA
jgi:hypothetical protein